MLHFRGQMSRIGLLVLCSAIVALVACHRAPNHKDQLVRLGVSIQPLPRADSAPIHAVVRRMLALRPDSLPVCLMVRDDSLKLYDLETRQLRSFGPRVRDWSSCSGRGVAVDSIGGKPVHIRITFYTLDVVLPRTPTSTIRRVHATIWAFTRFHGFECEVTPGMLMATCRGTAEGWS
jgi:hypothetical protein